MRERFNDWFPHAIPGTSGTKDMLTREVSELSRHPEIRGICLMWGSAHGYVVHVQVVQLANDECVLKMFSDVTSDVGLRSVRWGRDLAAVLEKLKSTWRGREIHSAKELDDQRGRLTNVCVGVKGDVATMMFQGPLIGAAPSDGLDELVVELWALVNPPSE